MRSKFESSGDLAWRNGSRHWGMDGFEIEDSKPCRRQSSTAQFRLLLMRGLMLIMMT